MSRYSPAFITMCAIPSASCDVNCAFRVERVHKYIPPLELQSQESRPNHAASSSLQKGGGGGGGGG